jgi:phage protein D
MSLLAQMSNGQSSVPDYRITISGKDVTETLDKRLMSLTITDNRGFEADQLDLELDDADGQLMLPRRGAQITVFLGWKGYSLTKKGTFVVDEIEHSGAPDRLTVRARSADFRQSLNIKREKSWHQTTVGEIVREIATRHKLTAALDEAMAAQQVDHIDQTNESDCSFLMRLAKEHGAIAAVKDGRLLFLRQGQGKTASGKPLPAAIITRDDGDSHRFTLADRGAYTGVVAHWLDTRETKKKKEVKVKRRRRRRRASTKKKKEPDPKQGEYLLGTDENVLVLSRTYLTKKLAERWAKSYWEKLQRGIASFSIDLARGREDLFPELPVKVSGFKREIDQADWTITTVTHSLNDRGFVTSLELEVKIDGLDMQ